MATVIEFPSQEEVEVICCSNCGNMELQLQVKDGVFQPYCPDCDTLLTIYFVEVDYKGGA